MLVRALLIGLVALVGSASPVSASGPIWYPPGDADLPWVDVTEFGVVCDGATDDTAAIIAALDSVTGRRGHFVFPAGICVTTGELIWSEVATAGAAGGVIIEGQGNDLTRIQYSGPGYALAFVDNFVALKDVHGVVVRDISIQAKQSAGATGALLLSGVEYPTIRDVRLFSDNFTAPFSALTVRNSLFGTYENVEVDSADTGISVAGINAVSNLFSSLQLQSDLGIDSTAAFSAAELCWAADEPYDCCTGVGTGTGADFRLCGADSQGGHSNMFANVNCRITEVDQCAVFGALSSNNSFYNLRDVKAGGGARTSGIDFGSEEQVVSGSVIDTDPINTSVTSFYGSAYSGNDSALDPDAIGASQVNAAPDTSLVTGSDVNVFADIDEDNDSAAAGWAVRNNGGADKLLELNEAGWLQLYGNTLIGNTTSGGDLTLQSTSHATKGNLFLDDQVSLWPSNTAASSVETFATYNQTLTLTDGGGVNLVYFNPTATIPDLSLVTAFRSGGSIDRTGTSGGTLYQWTGFYVDTSMTSSTTGGPLFQDAFYDRTAVRQLASTATQNTYQPISFLSKPQFSAASGATLTIGQTTGLDLNPTWGETAGGTFTNTTYSAVKVHTPTDAGGTLTLTNYIGIDLEDLDYTDVGTAYSMRSVGTTTILDHAGPGTFGQTLDVGDGVADITGTTTTRILDVRPTVDISGASAVFTGLDVSPTSAVSTNSTIMGMEFSPTLTLSGVVQVPKLYAVSFAGTSTVTGDTTFPTVEVLHHARTYTTATAASDPISAVVTLNDAPTISNTMTSGATSVGTSVVSVQHVPVLTMNGAGGEMTLGDDIGLKMGGTYNETAGTLNVTRRTGVDFDEVAVTGSPQITDNIGLDVAALTRGTGVVAGIRNADKTIFPPGTQAIAAASDTITCTGTTMHLTTVTGTTTMTSNPTVANGTSGEFCIITNVDVTGTDCVQFPDGTTGLQLGAARTMCPNDVLTLYYNGTDWLEKSWADN